MLNLIQSIVLHLPLLLLTDAAIDQSNNMNYWEQHQFSKPYFDQSTERDVTVTAGQTALLQCKVRNLGDRAVSWIRKGDLHILTVGILTYTNDQKFQTLHSDGTDEWTLRIASTKVGDSGTYECQISTEPKMSLSFRLNVVVSKAKIIGNSEIYIRSGSNINLSCLVETPDPPSFIYWYMNDSVLNYSSRGGINVITEKQTKSSRLLISKVEPHDSGNYTCSPSTSESASVFVHVLNEKKLNSKLNTLTSAFVITHVKWTRYLVKKQMIHKKQWTRYLAACPQWVQQAAAQNACRIR